MVVDGCEEEALSRDKYNVEVVHTDLSQGLILDREQDEVNMS
jgi:hypothetical protein